MDVREGVGEGDFRTLADTEEATCGCGEWMVVEPVAVGTAFGGGGAGLLGQKMNVDPSSHPAASASPFFPSVLTGQETRKVVFEAAKARSTG